MGIIIDFNEHEFTVRLEDGRCTTITCEEPYEFDYEIIKKIWEG